jgi:hypothetical protein
VFGLGGRADTSRFGRRCITIGRCMARSLFSAFADTYRQASFRSSRATGQPSPRGSSISSRVRPSTRRGSWQRSPAPAWSTERTSTASQRTANDLLFCCAAYQSLTDRGLERREEGAVGNFLLRLAGEQLTFQQSILNDLARTAALLEQTTPRKTLRTVSPGWPERLLGCKLKEYVGTAILLYTGALRNAGTFDLK